MNTGITLITMGAGNVVVLEETLISFIQAGICNEVIYGDLLLFPEDREIVRSYESKYNLKSVMYPFDYIFQNGFASILNDLAGYASNDMVIYMNTSEKVDENYGVNEAINNNPECNTFYFTHKTDPHRWYRCYNRHELKWSGMIHEQLKGEYKPYHKPIFMMKDLEKDMYSQFKAKVFDTTKEIVYFNNYMSIIDYPELLGETDIGWVKFAKDNYGSFKERLIAKGDGYKAFLKGDYRMFMEYVYANPEFGGCVFESNIGIEYQQNKKFLL